MVQMVMDKKIGGLVVWDRWALGGEGWRECWETGGLEVRDR